MSRSMGLIVLAAMAAGSGGCGTTVGNPAMVTLDIQGTKPGTLAARVGLPGLAEGLARGDLMGVAQDYAAAATSFDLDVIGKNGTSIGTLTVTKAQVALREIRFKVNDSEAEDDAADFNGPYIVNLVTDTVTPELSAIQLAAGTYTQIELKLHKTEDGDVAETDDMFHRSIYVEGTYDGTCAGCAGPVDFVGAFEFDEEFKLTPTGATSAGFTVAEEEASTVIVAFRLAKWLNFGDPDTNETDVDFSDVALNGSGDLVLDEDSTGSADDARAVVKENVKASADFGEDADGSGELETDEDDDEDSEDSEDD